MSESINGGGPAFPETGSRGKAASGEGMSLRDYFAAKAMQGLLASCPEGNDGFADPQGTPEMEKEMARQYAFGARLAYGYADAMLKAREAKP